MTLRAPERGLIPPFIAMDILRAANERQAQGDRLLVGTVVDDAACHDDGAAE